MPDLFLGGAIDAATHERLATDAAGDIDVDTGSLTTHGVIVGMTGSGKTGLGVILIEEALRAGLPVLAIDPKGDLTNLCLTFPDLAPADFRPWIDEARAADAGRSADDFAADEAALWRDGLAGWRLGGSDIAALRAATDFTIYTPGSRAGVPLDIVGSLQVPVDTSDDELVADEIEGYVTGLLGLVGIDADPLSSREHILLSNLIAHSWGEGRSLDLTTLVGMVPAPPIRKLGVFEIDQFFPADARMELAMQLNGLLASPSFASWAMGDPLDIGSMLQGADGRGRCAIVTTAHLSDDERQFVTSLILSKLVTWMRRQTGTTDLRALLYMDEVAGYLPPTEKPPTKKPIMTLMKQARAFGVGVVLSTQNPVDLDYKAMSNAGTWMVGRLQTERDRARLLDGMSSAAGDVDVGAVGDVISGLGKREFVLRRAGEDQPEVFTTRWAMSYLRGPMTRDQVQLVMADRVAATSPGTGAATESANVRRSAAPHATGADGATASDATSTGLGDDESAVVPEVADGVPVRWVDPAAPWATEVGGDFRGEVFDAAIVARVGVRYDEAKADLVHDEEYEAVLYPLSDPVDVARHVRVDYDDRDLRADEPSPAIYRLPPVDLSSKSGINGIERDLRDHLTRSLSLEIPANTELRLYGRPGESRDEFAARCAAAADERADAEIAALRDKYEDRAMRVRDQLEAAEDRVAVLEEEADAKRNSELFSTAGSVLGGLLGGRRSKGGLLGDLLGDAGTAARRRGSTSASARRVDAAENKVDRLAAQLDELEADVEEDVTAIAAKWDEAAGAITTMQIGVEKSDVSVTQLAVAWLPVARG